MTITQTSNRKLFVIKDIDGDLMIQERTRIGDRKWSDDRVVITVDELRRIAELCVAEKIT